MQSGIRSIGPSFNGSLVVRVCDGIRKGVPHYTRPVIYKTLPKHDCEMALFAGKAEQALTQEEKADCVTGLINYINSIGLTTPKGEVLKLKHPKGSGYSVSVGQSNIFVIRDIPSENDVSLQLMHMEIFA